MMALMLPASPYNKRISRTFAVTFVPIALQFDILMSVTSLLFEKEEEQDELMDCVINPRSLDHGSSQSDAARCEIQGIITYREIQIAVGRPFRHNRPDCRMGNADATRIHQHQLRLPSRSSSLINV